MVFGIRLGNVSDLGSVKAEIKGKIDSKFATTI